MGRIARAAAALTLCVAGAALAPAAVADAVLAPATSGQCPSGQLCVWSAAGYAGTFASVGSTTVKATGTAVARSVWNRSGQAAEVYSGTSASGTATCYDPGAQLSSTSIGARSFRLLAATSC